MRRYGLEQEYITPYYPEQNGMIERFFLTLKQECVWLQRFESRDHAFRVIAAWLDRYHTERPHSALGYLTPKEYAQRISSLSCTETRGTLQITRAVSSPPDITNVLSVGMEDGRIAEQDVIDLQTRSWIRRGAGAGTRAKGRIAIASRPGSARKVIFAPFHPDTRTLVFAELSHAWRSR